LGGEGDSGNVPKGGGMMAIRHLVRIEIDEAIQDDQVSLAIHQQEENNPSQNNLGIDIAATLRAVTSRCIHTLAIAIEEFRDDADTPLELELLEVCRRYIDYWRERDEERDSKLRKETP
jgi:hypothetical protein